jgi:hypothetical protein
MVWWQGFKPDGVSDRETSEAMPSFLLRKSRGSHKPLRLREGASTT